MTRTEDPNRKEALLLAAADEFGRMGYHRASIRRIAARAGCAVGTFYLYFESKEDCFLALIHDLYQRVMAAILASRAGGNTPDEKLQRSLWAVVEALIEHEGLTRLVLIPAMGTSGAVEAHLWRLQETFAQFIAEDLAGCGLPTERAQVGASAWVGALREVIMRWVEAAEEPTSLRAAMREVHRLFWAGWGLQDATLPSPAPSPDLGARRSRVVEKGPHGE